MKMRPDGWLYASLLLVMSLCAAPALLASELGSVPLGQANHGSGGPFLATQAFTTSAGGGQQLMVFGSGGSGYSYHGGGRLRVGGGGQGAFASTRSGDYTGRLSWGGLSVAYGAIQRGRLEIPVGLFLGGGSVTLSKELSSILLEQDRRTFMAVQGFTGLEYLALRTIKLVLGLSYLVGIKDGVALHGPGMNLQISFMIPRQGY